MRLALLLSILFATLTSVSEACMAMTPTTPGMPAVPCKNCATTLLTITKTGAGAKDFASDVTDRLASCATRTLTCTGMQATIELSDATGVLGTVDDGGTGTATLVATCNAAGTSWTYMGTPITKVECSAVPACTNCANNLIMVTQTGNGAKPMDDDQIVFTPCAQRTFTCQGTNANIEVFTAMGSQGTIGDGGTGTATFEVTCNAAGTAWESMGDAITRVECSAAAGAGTCKTCAQGTLITTKRGNGAKDFASDVTDTMGACNVRTLTCTGVNANIEAFSAMGMAGTITDMGTGTATFMVTCNADGTGWEAANGEVITEVECASA